MISSSKSSDDELILVGMELDLVGEDLDQRLEHIVGILIRHRLGPLIVDLRNLRQHRHGVDSCLGASPLEDGHRQLRALGLQQERHRRFLRRGEEGEDAEGLLAGAEGGEIGVLRGRGDDVENDLDASRFHQIVL
ncbi:hypothetical protein Cni_G28243 [Canna indica]|uniref:Uncharacterized protein n=1 Tax=Canna indica TaxID=4628 RepID=A0AAQ3L3I9_9LILI|nr:hypothetical protein Cni_G28243 [Canna indica]